MIFAVNALVAFCTDYQDGTDYEAVKADLVGLYGAAVPFSAEKLGNARFVIDDDGELDDCREMIEAEGLLIVLERDDDGDVDVTCLDTTAPLHQQLTGISGVPGPIQQNKGSWLPGMAASFL